MNMCIAYVGEGPVICIKPTKLKQYYYTLLTVTVYENGYFKKIDLAVYYPVKKGGHKCSMSGNGNYIMQQELNIELKTQIQITYGLIGNLFNEKFQLVHAWKNWCLNIH